MMIIKGRRVVLVLVGLLSVNRLYGQEDFGQRLSNAALELTNQKVSYDPSYFRMDYPNGDVPSDKGVCTDVVIRAYRKMGIDLQKEVHEDMTAHFDEYPQNWGSTKPDKNIDHRRVPNLVAFFQRFGTTLSCSSIASDYAPGDIVAWDLGNGVGHIGIVVHELSPDGQRPMIVHNIGSGQVLSDCLFSFPVTAHFRFMK